MTAMADLFTPTRTKPVSSSCYDPNMQVNVLCTSKQVDDAMCSYLAEVAKKRQKSSNSGIFIGIGAGILGQSSWLDYYIFENLEKVNFRTDYPWGASSSIRKSGDH